MLQGTAKEIPMAETVEIVRFTVDPDRREEFLWLRPAAINALRSAHGGLIEAWLVEQDDGTFIDLVHWRSREEAVAAAAAFPQIQAAQEWLSTIAEVNDMVHATLVDAR
jgi:quinol monooxygenase YgiN